LNADIAETPLHPGAAAGSIESPSCQKRGQVSMSQIDENYLMNEFA
jgi:hypothetical protein